MTFFQRIKTPFAEGPADEPGGTQPHMRLIGEQLQERREDLGLDLDEIGAMLCIKPAYLAALEQGRTHDLPGPTYAIGFVRAYAEFLGLEPEPVLARFKAEAAGVTARPDLALPVPLGERSVPGGALVLVALILALCGYGIWYYLSTEERNRPERVAAVPASLQAQPAVPVLVAPSSPSAPNADTSSPAPQPNLYGAAAGPAPSTTGSPVPTPQPQAPKPQPGSLPAAPAASAPPPAASAPSPAGPATASAPPVPSAQPPTPGPAALSSGTMITSASRTATPSAPPAVPVAAIQAAPLPPPSAAPGAPAQPPATQTAAVPSPAAASVPGAPAPAATGTSANAPATNGAGASRVAIRAVADCWIQVRGGDQIVFSHVLKAGEVYNVPARPGLTLRTGNAGALEIAVDGKTAPSIGSIGTLRRDVVLDPTELAAGTAVHG